MTNEHLESGLIEPEIIIEPPKDVAKMSQEKIEKLILLRAGNKSLSSIAKELHIAKSTVCNAVKYYENEINTEMYNIAEQLKEKYRISKERKLTKYMELLDKAYEEFEKREIDFSDMNLEELEKNISHLEANIARLTNELNLKTDIRVEGKPEIELMPDNSQIKILKFNL